jgi:hypothetical protein
MFVIFKAEIIYRNFYKYKIGKLKFIYMMLRM